MKAEHKLALLCAVLDVTRSGYHAWVNAPASARAQTDARLLPKIQELHQLHKSRFGAPRIHDQLTKQGHQHGCKRIARLMRQAGLRGLSPKRYVPQTTQSNHDQPIAPNLLAERAAPSGPNQIWVNDLTYVWTAEGWLYVGVVLDLWSRKIVGWATAPSLHATLSGNALKMALAHRQPARGCLHHSDRGVQYASREHRELLATAGLEPSMSRAGNPYDNAAMESFMATYKRECVGLAQAQGGYATRAEATNDFFDYVEKYYNRVRTHSALGYQTPVDFETNLN